MKIVESKCHAIGVKLAAVTTHVLGPVVHYLSEKKSTLKRAAIQHQMVNLRECNKSGCTEKGNCFDQILQLCCGLAI